MFTPRKVIPTPEDDAGRVWECGRCAWIEEGRVGLEIPDHHRTCVFRGTGQDPPAPADKATG
jgi:hypothetical protein